MDRTLLLIWASAAAGFTIAGVVDLSKGSRPGWLYLLAALLVIVPLWLSWRRLAASMGGGGDRACRMDAPVGHLAVVAATLAVRTSRMGVAHAGVLAEAHFQA